MKIIAQTYKEARLEYFKEQKEKYERKLEVYKKKKPSTMYSALDLHNICSECGWLINFYADAIKALEKES